MSVYFVNGIQIASFAHIIRLGLFYTNCLYMNVLAVKQLTFKHMKNNFKASHWWSV